jgi:hypothetical protein
MEWLRAALWLSVMIAVVVLWRAAKRRRRRVSSGTSGAIYDLLQEDKRKAIEIIVEGRAEAVDPEHADGILPKLTGQPQPTRRIDRSG